MMHVIDAILNSFSNLFRSHQYPPLEKLYSVILFIAGLSLRDLSERLCLTGASRESVRVWVHRFSSLFKPSKKARRLVAVVLSSWYYLPPLALMTLCITAAEACHEENDGTELVGRRVLMGSK
jgi:hypothetical protein